MIPHYEDDFWYADCWYDDWDYGLDEAEECDLCEGDGTIFDYRFGIGRVEVTCPVCMGDGYYT